MGKKTFENVRKLADLPNIGKAGLKDFEVLCIQKPEDLRGKDPLALYEELCLRTGKRHDPCVIDVFMSVVSFVEGGPPLPWWKFTERRKHVTGSADSKTKSSS